MANKALTEEQRDVLEVLVQRSFEFKVVTSEADKLKDLLGGERLDGGWVYIGHMKVEEKGQTHVKVFYARLLPEGSTYRSLKQFEMRYYLTFKLPEPRVIREQRELHGWNLLTKRWNAFDSDVSSDVCVTFFVSIKGRTVRKID